MTTERTEVNGSIWRRVDNPQAEAFNLLSDYSRKLIPSVKEVELVTGGDEGEGLVVASIQLRGREKLGLILGIVTADGRAFTTLAELHPLSRLGPNHWGSDWPEED